MKNNLSRFFKGFGFAWQGIVYAVKTQQNFRFHLTAAVWVFILSQFYDFSAAEKCVLILTVGSVLALELVNTAVEKTVDLYIKDAHPLAKAAKDTAAGAVLISAAAAVCTAVVLFSDTAVLKEVAAFLMMPSALAGGIVLAVLSVIFIFKGI
ncbi:MAG: diacylglycerol kinase family protein [Oscillospiraceae bacterium]|nr:diacylglycerol kinase family protein [Oscillospiraceae bacterium]